MVLVLPRTGCGCERLDLAEPQKLLLGRFRQEAAPLARAHEAVDVLDEFVFEDDVCTFIAHENQDSFICGLVEGPHEVYQECDCCQA